MLTRRQLLKSLLALLGSAVASACSRAIPTGAPSPTTQAVPIAAVPPTATALPTATPSPIPTATVPPTAAATATATRTPTQTATPRPPDLVYVRGDQFYYQGALFPINGFNYYPQLHPWRTFNIGHWDPRGTRRELELAAGLGANTVRIFIDYQFSLDNSKAQQPKDLYFAPIAQYVTNVREFLDIAGRLNMKVIVTLFDSLDWFMYQPQSAWIAEEYLKELVPPFADDPRILCWDLQNEPDRPLVLVGAPAVIGFFQRISDLVRKIDPRHLQTIGWIDRARGKYFPDLDRYLDFWSFHFYDQASRLNDLVVFYKSKTTKPVLLQEFGLATGGPGPDGQHTEQDQAQHYRTVLATLEANKMCGSVFWSLNDYPVGLAGNPPSPNDSPENHFGVFRLDYSEKPATAELRSFWKEHAPSRYQPI